MEMKSLISDLRVDLKEKRAEEGTNFISFLFISFIQFYRNN